MKLFACLLLFAVLFPAAAQDSLLPLLKEEAIQVKSEQSPYKIQLGDTMWDLAGAKLDDPRLWRAVVKQNPFLNDGKRVFVKDGKHYVLIKPGETLRGLEKLGVTPVLTPIEEIVVQSPVTVETITEPRYWFWLFWLILAALALLGVLWYSMNRMLNRNPATTGLPMYPHGVSNEQAGPAFQEMAARRYVQQNGVAAEARDFRIVDQTPGRIWGVLSIRYSGGRHVPRRLNGERAYRARVRFPDGHNETLFMLQACGNDLRYGGIEKYLPGPDFRFEEDVAQAQSAQAAAVPAQQEQTAPQTEAVPTATQVAGGVLAETNEADDEEATLMLHFDAANGRKPSNLVRVEGGGLQSFTFRMTKKGPTFRYKLAEPQTA